MHLGAGVCIPKRRLARGAIWAVTGTELRAGPARALAPRRDVTAATAQVSAHEARVTRAAVFVDEHPSAPEGQLQVGALDVQEPQRAVEAIGRRPPLAGRTDRARGENMGSADLYADRWP